MDCVFCKIVNNEVPSDKIYEDEQVLAFNDTNPQAPVHFLVIPKKHIENIREVSKDDLQIVSHIFDVIQNISSKLNLNDGMRIVNNCGENGGQTVNHLHFHVLAGRALGWPPGWEKSF